MFYERELQNGEVMAGNYMVRNTKLARSFLYYWASFSFVQPRGFSSADNGAIHQALVDVIGFDDGVRCRRAYDALTNGVNKLEPYWSFVACTKYLLGPARRWHVRHADWGAGAITVLPFYHSWCQDMPYLLGRFCNDVYPFCHGIKRSDAYNLLVDVPLPVAADGCLAHCAANGTHAVTSADELGRWAVANQAHMLTNRGPSYTDQLPVWPLPEHCLGRLDCRPHTDEDDWQRAYAQPPAQWQDSPWRREPLATSRSAARQAAVIEEIRAHASRNKLFFST